MAQPGIQSDDGTFNRKLLDEIEEDVRQRAIEVFGPDVDLSQGSPIKQLIDVVIFEHEYIQELLEEIYYSAYYGEAYEEQLDKVLQIAQITRIPRRGATGEVTFSAQVANDEDIVIPEGTRLMTQETENRPPIPFKTMEPATLEAGSAHVTNVPVRACEPWETDLDEEWLGRHTNVGANTITVMDETIGGIDHVRNPQPTGSASRENGFNYVQGRDRETDEELRDRFERQFGSQGTATLDALRAQTEAIDWVRSAGIEENNTMEDNREAGGLPPKSFRLTVLGDGPPNDVAQVISETRAAGIRSYGDVIGHGVTDDGVDRLEHFQWAEEIEISVHVNVTHDSRFPHDGAKRVEDAIIKYIGGTTADNHQFRGLDMGDNVIYDLVYKAAMSVRGVWTVDVYIGADLEDDESPEETDDIPIDQLNAAMTDHRAVTIFTDEQEMS
jgi:uncharacterized phage protein gp47/JayE